MFGCSCSVGRASHHDIVAGSGTTGYPPTIHVVKFDFGIAFVNRLNVNACYGIPENYHFLGVESVIAVIEHQQIGLTHVTVAEIAMVNDVGFVSLVEIEHL